MARERWFARQNELGLVPDGHRAGAPQPRASRPGTTCPRTTGAWPPAAGGVRRVPRPHRRPDRPAARRPRGARRARQHDHRPPVRQRGQPGGRPVRRPARDEVLQLHPRDARRGRRRASTTSAGRTATPTTRGAGPRPATRPFKWYKQNTHEGGVHVPLHRALAGGHRATPAACATSSTTSTTSPRRSTRLSASPRPTSLPGLEQMPVTGTSMRYLVRRRRRRRAEPQDACSTSR